MTYTVSPCPCGHRACRDWHVDGVAAVPGVHFTEAQARAVAALLNSGFVPEDLSADHDLVITDVRWKRVRRSSAPVSSSGWQPIDTAPTSGFGRPRRYVLVRGPSGMTGTDHFVVKAYHDAEYRPRDPWRMIDNGSLSDLGWEPIEWMEVPE